MLYYNRFNNSIIQEKNGILYLSDDIKSTLKSLCCMKTLRFCHYVICTQHSYGNVECSGSVGVTVLYP